MMCWYVLICIFCIVLLWLFKTHNFEYAIYRNIKTYSSNLSFDCFPTFPMDVLFSGLGSLTGFATQVAGEELKTKI